MCDVLKELYKKVYDNSFNYDDMDSRIMLQKAVYLIENMGVNVGDYSFSWDKYGPYSLALDYDSERCSKTSERAVTFSGYAEECINRLKSYVCNKEAYSCKCWVECIAALHYLRVVYHLDDVQIIEELKRRKPYLDNYAANQKALSIAKII